MKEYKEHKEYRVKVFEDKTEWYNLDDELHREEGPAIELENGSKLWYKKGKVHREDGPAVEYADGGKVWYKSGKLHREDGPAIEDANGDKFWYLNGKEYTEEEFLKKPRQSCAGKIVEFEGKRYRLEEI